MSSRTLMSLQLIFIIIYSVNAIAMNDYDMSELNGYTLVAESNVVGDFEGADFDKLVELDNGMIFRFQSYWYHYAYRPIAYVYEYYAPLEEVKAAVPDAASDIILYKLVIDDDIYDVYRVK